MSAEDDSMAGVPVTAGLATTIHVLQPKLPDFWENDPILWFISVEAQFNIANIQDDAAKKYMYVVAKLERPSLLNHVLDIIGGPALGRNYEALKTRLIQRFGDSQDAKFDRLLNMELGDKKPSHLLAEMQRESTFIGMSDEAIRLLFIKRLPPQIGQVLAVCNNSLEEMGRMADKMIVHTVPAVNQVNMGVESEMTKQIETLTAAVRELKMNAYKKPEERRSKQKPSSNLCWYHETYGDRARRCRSPCARKTKN